jgi:hypothetical protein
MGRRLPALALGSALAAAAAWAACSSDEPHGRPAGKDGGAGAGGTVASGGSGALGGTMPSGGTGGSGGTPGDAGEWGALPNWVAFPGSAVGCTYERMTNAAQIRFFKWEPCSWTDGCEQAVFNPTLFGQNVSFGNNSTVVDDGTSVRVGLTIWSEHNMAVIAGEDGMGMDGIRDTGGTFDCRLAASSIWKDRFAIHVTDYDVKHFGGILGKVGDTTPPVAFTIPEPPPAGGTQQFVLGDTRWLWWWAPVDRLSTVSATDGSNFQIFAKFGGSIVGYSNSATTGPLFLAQEYEVQDGGHVQGKIAYSDGVSPMKPYLVPPDPNDDYAYPAFADSYVGFMRGISQKNVNVYDSVEIWATPYSTDPSQLKPEFVASFPYASAAPMAGGWGRLATGTMVPPKGDAGVAIWTLGNKSVVTYPMPETYTRWALVGLTRTHFWLGAQKPAMGDEAYLMRFKVE